MHTKLEKAPRCVSPAQAHEITARGEPNTVARGRATLVPAWRITVTRRPRRDSNCHWYQRLVSTAGEGHPQKGAIMLIRELSQNSVPLR